MTDEEPYEIAVNISENEDWELIELDKEFSISTLYEEKVCSITVDKENEEVVTEYITEDGDVFYENVRDMDGLDDAEPLVESKHEVDRDIENNGILAKLL